MPRIRVAHCKSNGASSVITVTDTPEPGPPGRGEVSVDVVAAGLNPADLIVCRDQFAHAAGECRIGGEFSGRIREVGPGVDSVLPGDEVLGTGQGLLAERAVVPADDVMPIPHGVSWDLAAVLPIAAQTAWLAVESQQVQPGQVVLVSAAAGGVGVVMCQLLQHRGATVVGTASPHHHGYLEALGVTPVDYHGNLTQNLRKVVPAIDRVFDNSGYETIEAGLEMGAATATITSLSGAGPRYGVATVSPVGVDRRVITSLAQSIVDGRLVIPLHVQPFDELAKAFIDLELRTRPGKTVVRIQPATER